MNALIVLVRYLIALYSMPKCALEICQFVLLKLVHQNKRKSMSIQTRTINRY